MIYSDLAYIIHSQSYRETSQLLTVFTRDLGRFSMVFNGARSRKRQGQAFCLVQISWSGKTELKTIRSMEVVEHGLLLGQHLYIGLYLNELLARVLREAESAAPVFDRYHHLIQKLAARQDNIETLLRSFEFTLLDELGYGFTLVSDARGETVIPGCNYTFDPSQGLIAADVMDYEQSRAVFPGEHLLAMAEMDYSDDRVRLTAKRLMREALKPHLGSRPLMSRELFKGHFPNAGAVE